MMYANRDGHGCRQAEQNQQWIEPFAVRESRESGFAQEGQGGGLLCGESGKP